VALQSGRGAGRLGTRSRERPRPAVICVGRVGSSLWLVRASLWPVRARTVVALLWRPLDQGQGDAQERGRLLADRVLSCCHGPALHLDGVCEGAHWARFPCLEQHGQCLLIRWVILLGVQETEVASRVRKSLPAQLSSSRRTSSSASTGTDCWWVIGGWAFAIGDAGSRPRLRASGELL
jgi:hypothetical protein